MKEVTGYPALAALGYSQASLARMFDVDTATTNQWHRFNRVGERMLGRVKFIPELKSKVTPAQLRPDLSKERIAASVAEAKEWWAKDANKTRDREQPQAARKAKAPAKKAPKAKKVKRKVAAKHAQVGEMFGKDSDTQHA
jgi:DNA-binding transcriptional regulator YdaS (Cro superfamily)